MSVLDGPSQGDWSVYAGVVQERLDAANDTIARLTHELSERTQERDEAVRRLNERMGMVCETCANFDDGSDECAFGVECSLKIMPSPTPADYCSVWRKGRGAGKK